MPCYKRQCLTTIIISKKITLTSAWLVPFVGGINAPSTPATDDVMSCHNPHTMYHHSKPMLLTTGTSTVYITTRMKLESDNIKCS